jgi:hypothetical protein
MNPKSDPRVRFEPELMLRTVTAEPPGRRWLPALIPADYAIAPTYWLTRASRGISWHRAGRCTRPGDRACAVVPTGGAINRCVPRS